MPRSHGTGDSSGGVARRSGEDGPMGRDRARESCHRCGGSDSSFCECKTAFRGNPAKSGLLLREMVPTAGLEPATSRLGGGRSVPTELRGRGCGGSPDLREPPARYTCRAGAPGTGAANPGRIRAVPRACHATDRLLTPCHLGHRSAAWRARVWRARHGGGLFCDVLCGTQMISDYLKPPPWRTRLGGSCRAGTATPPPVRSSRL